MIDSLQDVPVRVRIAGRTVRLTVPIAPTATPSTIRAEVSARVAEYCRQVQGEGRLVAEAADRYVWRVLDAARA